MTPEEIELALRREWWINHGHSYHALYGDDGEMQCAACHPPMDFKRTSMETLHTHVRACRLERAAEVARA